MIFSPRREDNPMTTIRTILHPTDFSATSELAFAYACELARSYKARLIALHVVQPVVPVAVDGILVPIDVDELQREAQARFQQLPPATSGVDFERLVREGPAGRTIVQVAAELGADLIVIGTHGRTGIGRVLLGSVAEEVLRRAPCPILTVR